MRWTLLIIVTLGLMAGCAAHNPPQPGQIVAGEGWRIISPDQLDERVGQAQVVLVGERHANKDDHQLQLKALKTMADLHPGLVVGVEWLESGVQGICDRLSRGELSTEEFAQEVEWTRKWGHNFQVYEPIFAEVKKRGLKLIALNAPVEIVRTIARKGIRGLTPEERGILPPAMQLDDPEYLKYIADQFKGHGVLNPQAEKNFLAAQIARDENMAHRFALALAPWPEGNKHGVLFAGRGHMEMDLGLPPRLERRLPGLKKLVVMPVSDHEAKALQKMGEAPLKDHVWVVTKPPKPRQRGRLGLVLRKTDEGLGVVHVRAESPAAKAGIKVGDTLSAIDGKPLETAKGIHDVIKNAPYDPHTYTILRDGETLLIIISLPKPKAQDK